MQAQLSFPVAPSLAGAYLRALLDRRPRRLAPGHSSPLIEAEVGALQAEPGRVAAYREVCELPDDGNLPLPYPHILAASTHMNMLLNPVFPVRLVGLVHLSHVIELIAALPVSAPLALDCRLEEGRRTMRGDEFRLVTEALSAGQLAWRETMGFLVPAGGLGRKSPPERSELPACVGEWPVPANIGRRYARVSGDWNPIHLAGVLARPFGFRGAIAHGMWTLTRCLGWLASGPVTPGARLEARFLRPLLLPARVRLHAGGTGPDGEREFWLVSDGSAIPHLRGRWRPGGQV